MIKLNKDKIQIRYITGIGKCQLNYPTALDILYESCVENADETLFSHAKMENRYGASDEKISEIINELLDKKYIEKIDKIQLPNTKVKILHQLLLQAINEFKKVNKIKALTFSERLQNIVNMYNARSMDATEVTAILDEVASDLIELMSELAEEKNSLINSIKE